MEERERDLNLPKLQSAEDIAKAELEKRLVENAEELRNYWLDPSEDYPEPRFLFSYNGTGFSPLGGIQAISGQKKNGKTFMLSLLMAAALSGDSMRAKSHLGALSLNPTTAEWLGKPPTVLYCDTEMEKLNTAKVLRRVHWLCGWDMKERNERLHVLWLREVPKREPQSANKERYRLVRNAIELLKPTIVFIDGLRDLVDDFNDNNEASEIVGELMGIASRYNCCVWNVLHMNPRPGNDDESKMRGHLGTELGNKVSDTFVVSKKKDSATGQALFTVKQQDARGKDIEDWTFEITDDAGHLGIPKIMSSVVPTRVAVDDNTRQIDEMLRKFKWTSYGATYTELERWLRQGCSITSNRRIGSIFDTAMEAGIIVKDDRKKYHYKGLTGTMPNDEVGDLPFSASSEDDVPF